jgi:hypothetical protein
MNVAFTKHITNALMKIREEKLKQKVSIPKKLEYGWETIINMNVNDLDVECNASCPIILERPFLRTVGAIIDMKEGTIKYQFPLKKGMEHFPRKRKKLLFDSILRANYELDASSLDIT